MFTLIGNEVVHEAYVWLEVLRSTLSCRVFLFLT